MYPYLTIFLTGWIAAGLVNYLADFLPIERHLVLPYCKTCREKIPALLYFLLPLRCPHCKQGRGIRAWLLYPIYILIGYWLWQNPNPKLGFLLSLLICIYFGVVVVIDLEHRLILHPVSLFGTILGFWAGWVQRGVLMTVIGGSAGFVIMFCLYLGGRLFLRLLSRKRQYEEIDEALGFGDVTLAGVVGLLLGWPGVVVGLALAVFLAGAMSLFILLVLSLRRRYRPTATIAYGPYLVASVFILLFLKDICASLF